MGGRWRWMGRGGNKGVRKEGENGHLDVDKLIFEIFK